MIYYYCPLLCCFSFLFTIKPKSNNKFLVNWENCFFSLWLLSVHFNKKSLVFNKQKRTGQLHQNNQPENNYIHLSLRYYLRKVYKCGGFKFNLAARVLRHHHICLVCFFSHRHRTNTGSQEERLTPPSLSCSPEAGNNGLAFEQRALWEKKIFLGLQRRTSGNREVCGKQSVRHSKGHKWSQRRQNVGQSGWRVETRWQMNWTLVLGELLTQWGKTDVTAETCCQEANPIDAWAPNAAETPEMSDNGEVIRPTTYIYI